MMSSVIDLLLQIAPSLATWGGGNKSVKNHHKSLVSLFSEAQIRVIGSTSNSLDIKQTKIVVSLFTLVAQLVFSPFDS